MPNITLERFMIFNSSEGCSESHESEKLLYHWTKSLTASFAEQIDDICLCDASVNVSILLSSSTEPQQSNNGRSLVLEFEKTLVLIAEVEAEQSIWMAVHVAPPITSPSDLSCIPADTIERVMNNIYARFCLLNGTFKMIADDIVRSQPSDLDDRKLRDIIREKTRHMCNEYFDKVLPNIHLNSIVSNVASLYNYILYLDLNPLVLMRVNSFINHLVSLNPMVIRNTIVIFNDQLLWSSLNMYDTRLLYNYLVSVVIRDALQEELSTEVDKVRRIVDSKQINLIDNCECFNEASLIPLETQQRHEGQQFKVQNTKKLTKYYLTVFRSSNNITLGLILSEPNQSDLIQKCEQILTSDSRLGVIPLVSLGQTVGQSFLKANSSHHLNQSLAAQSSSQSQSGDSPSSTSAQGWRKSNNQQVLKSIIPHDQKYVFMDRLDVSISWPLSIDMQNKEYLLLSQHEVPGGREVQSTNQINSRKSSLIRYLIELEPDLNQIKRQTCGNSVVEFFGRTLNDSWLTVTNSKYRTIYSMNDVRNSGLSEAQQSAHNLKSIFIGNRKKTE